MVLGLVRPVRPVGEPNAGKRKSKKLLENPATSASRALPLMGEMEGAFSFLPSPQPRLRVESSGFFANLEMERAVARTVGSYSAEGLTSVYLLPIMDRDRREVAINGHVFAVADNDIVHTSEGEDGCHLTSVDSARLCTRVSRNVDTLVVKTNSV